MAPSQNQDMESLQYTHKKFNCGYSHKKLGMRLMRRNSQEEEMEQQTTQVSSSNSQKPALFRPYDLDNTQSCKKPTQPQIEMHQTPASPVLDTQNYLSYYALQQSVQQSQEEYALKLQRQRAALYMKHVMQFYENGNGWPSVHPNAINNPQLYHNY